MLNVDHGMDCLSVYYSIKVLLKTIMQLLVSQDLTVDSNALMIYHVCACT